MRTKKAGVPAEVSAYFTELGRKSGQKLREERGSEYFKKISAMRKNPWGRKSGKIDDNAEEDKQK